MRRQTVAERLGIYWPFPRARYWLRHGHSCTHVWTPSTQGRRDGWDRIDGTIGRQMRRCFVCEYAQFR